MIRTIDDEEVLAVLRDLGMALRDQQPLVALRVWRSLRPDLLALVNGAVAEALAGYLTTPVRPPSVRSRLTATPAVAQDVPRRSTRERLRGPWHRQPGYDDPAPESQP